MISVNYNDVNFTSNNSIPSFKNETTVLNLVAHQKGVFIPQNEGNYGELDKISVANKLSFVHISPSLVNIIKENYRIPKDKGLLIMKVDYSNKLINQTNTSSSSFVEFYNPVDFSKINISQFGGSIVYNLPINHITKKRMNFDSINQNIQSFNFNPSYSFNISDRNNIFYSSRCIQVSSTSLNGFEYDLTVNMRRKIYSSQKYSCVDLQNNTGSSCLNKNMLTINSTNYLQCVCNRTSEIAYQYDSQIPLVPLSNLNYDIVGCGNVIMVINTLK